MTPTHPTTFESASDQTTPFLEGASRSEGVAIPVLPPRSLRSRTPSAGRGNQHDPLFRGEVKKKLGFWVSLLFFVPQRIGIDVGWVDVKGFLIMSALRKSTHHSKESTRKY